MSALQQLQVLQERMATRSQHYHQALKSLLSLAVAEGFVLTIETKPKTSGMGDYAYEVSVRPARPLYQRIMELECQAGQEIGDMSQAEAENAP